jgi:lipopolysaccharide/colanic/teichoic acid biosynthesis glycosyltransferase
MMSPNDTGVFTWDGVPPWEASIPSVPASRRPALAVKRGLDVVLSLVLLVLTAPILLSAVAAVRLTSRGRALFVQPRIGYRCRRFSMVKLRTMTQGAEEQEARLAEERTGGKVFFKLADDPRVTRVGRFLRRFSLDELPQLFNVLSGDMSLVGPRPPLLSDFRKFPRHHRRCFSMKPGLTGLWQVSGRSLLSDEERFRLDAEYVDDWSLGLDLAILARTLPVVLSGRGAS